ncbi:MAG: hypothetical protein ACK5KM_14345, partial [Hyphomicrobiaceae bacterium]
LQDEPMSVQGMQTYWLNSEAIMPAQRIISQNRFKRMVRNSECGNAASLNILTGSEQERRPNG